MVGRNPVACSRKTARVIADDVVAQSPRAAEPRGNRQIVLGGEFDRFLAADDRHPDRRVRLLYRPRPHRDVFIGPEFTSIGEYFLGPGLSDDLERLLEAGARLRQLHVMDLVLPRDAPGKA